MSWFTIEKIDDTTFAISEYGHWEKVRSFLLIGKERALLIDCGLGIGNLKKVVSGLTELPVKVVLTHVHWDHIGGLADFETIYVHQADAQWLVKGIDYWTNERVVNELTRAVTCEFPPEFEPANYQMYIGQPSSRLVGGEIVDLGGRKVKVLHTPGHSPGHICLVDLTREYLFTGDILYSKETPIYANYPSTSPHDLVQSLLSLTTIPAVKKILPSHNSLELPVSILLEVKEACTYLLANDLVGHGTGLHSFKQFKLLF